MPKRNIVIIGAGSASFTTGLLADLILEGSEWEVRLADINAESLEIAYNLAKRMLKARPAPIELKKSIRRRRLLPGADFVVTTIAVGGRRAWERDVLIPRRFGIYQPVGDTIMPGGISRALRMIPPMVEIARDIQRLCPKARLFNYSNPMAAIVYAVNKATGLPAAGLCHGIAHVERYLAGFLGLPAKDCRFAYAGINHHCWFHDLKIKGKKSLPRLRKKYLAMKQRGKPYGGDPENPLSWELFEVFGAFPAVLDRHVAEFYPQFHREGEHYGKILGHTRFSFEQTIGDGDAQFRKMTDMARGKIPLDENLFSHTLGEHEQLVPILNALAGARARRFPVIVPNTGQAKWLERGLPLECPAMISKKGIRPEPIPRLSTALRASIKRDLHVVELAAEAALECDRDKFLQALILDGSVSSVSQARELAQALLQAHAQHLDRKRWKL